MEPCIARCVFYITNEMQLIQCFLLYYYQRCTCFGRFFCPSSGAYKTVCAALGIVMLSIHTSSRQQESMTIPKAAHTVL